VSPPPLRAALTATLLVAASTSAACSTGVDSTTDQREITVLAASSLTEAFPDIATAFTESNPNASVTFSFAGSQELVAQVDNGAPADL
jgi:molybdate transport system substrate-binding protein